MGTRNWARNDLKEESDRENQSVNCSQVCFKGDVIIFMIVVVVDVVNITNKSQSFLQPNNND